ncbi:MAG TPA: hypothetical protein ENJ97_07320 [Planctomycetes bacterium]|nr:hypothetical protein [Planctomycetota bacterium]
MDQLLRQGRLVLRGRGAGDPGDRLAAQGGEGGPGAPGGPGRGEELPGCLRPYSPGGGPPPRGLGEDPAEGLVFRNREGTEEGWARLP